MSYRELRDAVEILRALHYPRLVSMENFRLPNFPLMAEILEWTVKKFDSNYRVPKSIDTEQDRVLFVKTCVLALVQKARVKLNPKNLYQSDGYAVRELLPVLKLLYEGTKRSADENEQKAHLNVLRSQIATKRQEIRDCTNRVLELPQHSATLYDMLAKELVMRETRTRALSQSLNIRDVEQSLRAMVAATRAQLHDIQNKMDNISNDEATLDEKISRKERELEQSHKRLAQLQSFRAPHMDEFERLEVRLQNLYNEYILLFRNLSYLNERLTEVEKAEQEKSHEAEKSMRLTVEKMRNESQKLPQLSGAEVENVKQNVIKFYGNMTGAGLSDDDDDDEEEDDEEVEDSPPLDHDVDEDELDLRIKELDDAESADEDLARARPQRRRDAPRRLGPARDSSARTASAGSPRHSAGSQRPSLHQPRLSTSHTHSARTPTPAHDDGNAHRTAVFEDLTRADEAPIARDPIKFEVGSDGESELRPPTAAFSDEDALERQSKPVQLEQRDDSDDDF